VNNYDALIAVLAPANSQVTFVASDNLDPTGLTYACPTSATMCPPEAYASTYENGRGNVAGNIILFCPRFFELVDQRTMVSNWLRSQFTPSQGFAMLHEVQHTTAIVGAARRCADQPDPRGGGCYDSSW
jgi:hypothetical protein